MKSVETVAHRLTWKLGPMSVQNSEAPLEEHECMKKQMKAGVFCVVKFISERGTADTFFLESWRRVLCRSGKERKDSRQRGSQTVAESG